MSKTSVLSIKTATYGACIVATLIAGTAPAALTYFVDPYEIFRTGDLSRKRKEISEKAHYPLWKFAHYDRSADLVILGDSRARALQDKYWTEYGYGQAFNFAYGGGTIPEIYSTFKAIKNDSNLKTIVVGIQLRSFDETHKGGLNRVPEARKAVATRFSYLKNWFVARQSWTFFEEDHPKFIRPVKSLLIPLSGVAYAAELGRPGQTTVKTLLLPDVCFGCELPSNGKEFDAPVAKKGPNLGLGRGRRHTFSGNISMRSKQPLPAIFLKQVRKNATSDWKGFQFSERYMRMLKEISKWADARSDRKLIFVIPPTVVEMQGTIASYGLSEMNQTFRKRLRQLAPIVDLDFPSQLTRDVRNFSDAYHFKPNVARHIVGEVMAVSGATPEQAERINDKRKSILCPSPDLMNEVETYEQFSEGKSCRLWERNKDA